MRMSQVAAMLNYGEMQILENFKKNPSISTLFNPDKCKQSQRCY